MNPWLLAGFGLLSSLVPVGIASFRGSAMDRLAAIEAAATVVTLALLVLAQGFGRPAFFDVALVEAFLSFGGGLAFVRFLERWL